MVDIATAILRLRPNANFGTGGNVRLEQIANDSARIVYWDPVLGTQPTTAELAATVPSKPELKAQALINARAVGFSLDQLRVIRAVVLLATGTPQQKTKAQALLAPLLQLCNDAKAAADAIDADTVPPAIIVPKINLEDL